MDVYYSPGWGSNLLHKARTSGTTYRCFWLSWLSSELGKKESIRSKIPESVNWLAIGFEWLQKRPRILRRFVMLKSVKCVYPPADSVLMVFSAYFWLGLKSLAIWTKWLRITLCTLADKNTSKSLWPNKLKLWESLRKTLVTISNLDFSVSECAPWWRI